MATGVLQAWSTTASSNGAADSAINLAEGQTPASLNDAGRAVMAGVKGWANQITGAKTSGGSANAYTFTSDSVAAVTSLAAGRALVFVANHTNSGAATLNVDGIGATAIRKGGAQTALSANDIVANGVYHVVYNGTYWILLNPESGAVSAQPLDATLTALAALSWSSGNALVQFTAADTVSLTLTPSVTSVAVAAGSNTAPGFWFASDTQTGFYRLSANTWGWSAAGTLAWLISGLQISAQNNGVFLPGNGSAGAPGFAFKNDTDCGLYLIGANNVGMAVGGSKVVDYASTLVAFSTAVQARVPLSSETSGTLTVASANKKVACSGGITLDDGVFTTDDFIVFDPGTSNRTFTRAAGLTMYVNGTDSASATLAANQMGAAHWRSSTVVVLTGAFS